MRRERTVFFIYIHKFNYMSQSKPNKIPEINKSQPSEKGKKIFQPNLINWSYLYLGKAALTQTNTKRTIVVFRPNQINPGIKLKRIKFIGESQPPRKYMVTVVDIRIIFAYSPKKKRAKPIAEYSVLYPETSSASASGKSKGDLLVSARPEIKNIINAGNKGTTNHISFWAKTIWVKFKEPEHIITEIIIKPIDTS